MYSSMFSGLLIPIILPRSRHFRASVFRNLQIATVRLLEATPIKDTDDILRRHRAKPKRQLSSDFTNNIMSVIEAHPRNNSKFRHALQELYMRFTRLPKAAMAVLAIVAIAGGSTATYAAASWLVLR